MKSTKFVLLFASIFLLFPAIQFALSENKTPVALIRYDEDGDEVYFLRS